MKFTSTATLSFLAYSSLTMSTANAGGLRNRFGDREEGSGFPGFQRDGGAPLFQEGRPSGGPKMARGNETLDCSGFDPIPCGLLFGKEGVLACRTLPEIPEDLPEGVPENITEALELFDFPTDKTICVDPEASMTDDVCGVCEEDSVPPVCTCDCSTDKVPEGKLIQSARTTEPKCVPELMTVTLQLVGTRFSCVEDCS